MLGSNFRSAAQGPSYLGGAWGGMWSVYTGLAPTILLPWTCQPGTAAVSTAPQGCQLCCVTWSGVNSLSEPQFPPLETTTHDCEGYVVVAAALIPAAVANKTPRGLSALLRVGHPGPSPLDIRWEGPWDPPRLAPAWPPGRGGRKAHSSQTPESQFPFAASTRRERETWVEAGEGTELVGEGVES